MHRNNFSVFKLELKSSGLVENCQEKLNHNTI